MINFKNESDRAHFQDLHPKLKEIVGHMEFYADLIGVNLVVTSIVRNDGTTHQQTPPYRFIDIRSNNFPDKEAEKLRQIINRFYPYGLTSKGKKTDTIVALNHSDTSPTATAEHFHVQVPRG